MEYNLLLQALSAAPSTNPQVGLLREGNAKGQVTASLRLTAQAGARDDCALRPVGVLLKEELDQRASLTERKLVHHSRALASLMPRCPVIPHCPTQGTLQAERLLSLSPNLKVNPITYNQPHPLQNNMASAGG